MIGGKRVIAIIPARGGSQSVPLKNLKEVGGKPLIVWTIEAARATPEIDRILVSTDHAGTASIAQQYGAEVLHRPTELASRAALVADMLRYHISELRAQGEMAHYLVLLQPTSPFRLPRHISECLAMLETNRFDSVATFVEAALNPHRAWRMTERGPEPFIPGAVPWLPRQQLPPACQLNGAVYAFVADRLSVDCPGVLFGRIGAVMMDRVRSLDIDDALDFLVADALINSDLLSNF
jgi:N-acylneuraminate cytidylyltransferase